MEYKKLKKLKKDDEFYPFRKFLIGKEFLLLENSDCRLRYLKDYLPIQFDLDNSFWFLPHENLWDE